MNNINYKKYLKYILFSSIIVLSLFLVLNIIEYKTYTNNYNNKINSILNKIEEKYPDIKETELIEIINNNDSNKDILNQYGISKYDSAIKSNNNYFYKYLIINILYLFISIIIVILVFNKYNKKQESLVKEITKSIEQINKKNYELNLDSMSEDELSILKNEIYKTTIMLKEAADNSLTDKINLKKSLEDISHQLKTPLTSILIMLDDLIDDPDMDESIRNDFINDIRRNTLNISFLVQTLLKLSKFDSNTVNFINKETKISDIVNESIKNVSSLSDLKNIDINLDINKDGKIICDKSWQIEAITNLLKNALDHSKNDSNILIEIDDNKVYSIIKVTNYGEVIDEEDKLHIFERFYKGKNANTDSVGIGLALAKNIIEENNGIILLSSDNNSTTFTVKYLKM